MITAEKPKIEMHTAEEWKKINEEKEKIYSQKVKMYPQELREKIKEYSLGMKQKLRIAQAIMENQQLIILDEPTNGLDETSVKKLHEIVKQLKKQNKLVLIASHNKEDLNELCDILRFVKYKFLCYYRHYKKTRNL